MWTQRAATGKSGQHSSAFTSSALEPHWAVNSGRGQKLYPLYKQSPKAEHTESFFALCENWGGLYSRPLCWCLSTVPLEARPIVRTSVSYWPKSVPALFPGSKWRGTECLKRANHRLDAFCCIVIWPIKSKLRSALMQTGNYIVTAAAIDIWLLPHRKKIRGFRPVSRFLYAGHSCFLTENGSRVGRTERSPRWLLSHHFWPQLSACISLCPHSAFPWLRTSSLGSVFVFKACEVRGCYASFLDYPSRILSLPVTSSFRLLPVFYPRSHCRLPQWAMVFARGPRSLSWQVRWSELRLMAINYVKKAYPF